MPEPKQVPHVEHSEHAVLGGCMMNSVEAFAVLAEYNVTPEWFYVPSMRMLFEKLSAIPPTEVDVIYASQVASFSAGVIPQEAVDRCLESCFSMSHFRFHVEQMKDAYTRRMLISMSHDQFNQSYSDETSGAQALSEQVSALIKFQSQISANVVRTPAEVYDELLREIQARRDGTGKHGIPCHIPRLNSMLGGYQGVCVLAARPGMGKSTFLGNSLAHLAAKDYRVSLASNEMTEQDFRLRILCSHARVSSFHAQIGKLQHSDYAKLVYSAGVQKNWKFRISDASMSIDQFCGWMAAEVRVHKAQIIALDYFQILVSAGKRNENRYQEMSRWMNMIRESQKRLGVPVLLLSQMSREYEKEGRKPRMSDLRDSGSIEQDATQIVFLHKEDDQYSAIIAKNRHGPTGEVGLVFEKTYSSFSEVAQPEGKYEDLSTDWQS